MGESELIELEAALEMVLARASRLEAETVEIGEALRRVIATDAVADAPVPGFDNSAMDGFVVRSADTEAAGPEHPVRLKVVGESQAGRPDTRRLSGREAMQISTGAMIPEGADAVIRVEETRSDGDWVEMASPVPVGQDIRRAGEDVRVGETVIRSGSRLGPAGLGVLAGMGLEWISCTRRPRVAILTSGDELVAPGEQMRPGGVRNSNGAAISALASVAGAEVVSVSTVRDDPDLTRAAISAILDCDLAVVCGGVSVGLHDHVRPALAELGVSEHFWRVALKPGKPTWFGSRGKTLVFGLPGNPVSAMVTFMLLVEPALAVLVGESTLRRRTTARLDGPYEKRPGRLHAVRCTMDLKSDGWHVKPRTRQGSHVLSAMLDADCLALVPTASASLAGGESVEIQIMRRD